MKNTFVYYIIILSIFIIPLKGFGETPEEYRVKDSDLSIEAAKGNLNSIEAALKDFRGFTAMVLTDEVVDKLKEDKAVADFKIKAKDLKKFSSIDWSTQNIGFNNWVLILRGALLRSEYLTRKYEYDLAKCRKNLSGKELSNLGKAVSNAFQEYQNFLSQATFAD